MVHVLLKALMCLAHAFVGWNKTNKNKQQQQQKKESDAFESKHCLFPNLVYALNSLVIIFSKVVSLRKEKKAKPLFNPSLLSHS